VGDHKALVLIKGIGEVPLSVKEPLDHKQLYHAVLSQTKEGFVLKELFKLPDSLKQLLALKPLMSIEQFIAQLVTGKSVQKVAFEALTQQILQLADPEQVETQLQQLFNLMQTKEPIIPLRFEEGQGYVKFKKKDKKDAQLKVPFEAYFQRLGMITGYLAVYENKKQAHLEVLTLQTQELLQSHAKKLPMELFVTVNKKIELTATTSLLDIQV
jgi:hypothetical protein